MSGQRWLVFNLDYWNNWLFSPVIEDGRKWAVVPACEAGCMSAHRIGWDGIAFATWREAFDYATNRGATRCGCSCVHCADGDHPMSCFCEATW